MATFAQTESYLASIGIAALNSSSGSSTVASMQAQLASVNQQIAAEKQSIATLQQEIANTNSQIGDWSAKVQTLISKVTVNQKIQNLVSQFSAGVLHISGNQYSSELDALEQQAGHVTSGLPPLINIPESSAYQIQLAQQAAANAQQAQAAATSAASAYSRALSNGNFPAAINLYDAVQQANQNLQSAQNQQVLEGLQAAAENTNVNPIVFTLTPQQAQQALPATIRPYVTPDEAQIMLTSGVTTYFGPNG